MNKKKPEDVGTRRTIYLSAEANKIYNKLANKGPFVSQAIIEKDAIDNVLEIGKKFIDRK